MNSISAAPGQGRLRAVLRKIGLSAGRRPQPLPFRNARMLRDLGLAETDFDTELRDPFLRW